MTELMKQVLERKKMARLELANLPIGEKLEMVERLRERSLSLAGSRFRSLIQTSISGSAVEKLQEPHILGTTIVVCRPQTAQPYTPHTWVSVIA